MASKRKFCEHCEEYVTLRTRRLHADLYCHKTSEEVYSSEEEEIAGDDFEDVNVDRNMEYEAEDQGIEATSQGPSGTNVQDLEEEDAVLVHDILSPESDADMLYHERVGPELTRQVWNLADEDIDGDFPIIPEQYPSVYVNPAQGLQDSFNCIIRWILLVLCLWSSFCVISDNAMEILLEFLRAVFDSLATVVPGIGSFAALFPKSLHLLKKQLGIDQDKFIKYVVCPKCDTLYNFDDCYELQNRKRVLKKCTFIEFPNHRQHFRRTQCGEPLLREVTLKSGQTRLYPFKVYCYQSVRDTLRRFIQRPGFAMKCELWRERDVPHGFLADVFDGRVWKEWQYVNGKAFLAVSGNYAFMLNVDWFQPFKHSLYSVGALYMVLMNLPRSERFKLENVMLVGIIPGPHEPKLTINSYLQPLVAELNLLWKQLNTATSIGRIPRKIGTNYGNYTAEEWKNWTLTFSMYALYGIIPDNHLRVWERFVLACRILCQPVITKQEIKKADALLVNFCTGMEKLYGKQFLTCNMHLHCHLHSVLLDYGPVFGFWLFSFERYNGQIGSTLTNNRSVENPFFRAVIVQRLHLNHVRF